MPHTQIRREIVAFANEMHYFPTDDQVEAIRVHFESLLGQYRTAHPDAVIKFHDEIYDRMLWDSIEAVMHPRRPLG